VSNFRPDGPHQFFFAALVQRFVAPPAARRSLGSAGLLAISALVAGLLATHYGYLASKIEIDRGWPTEPGDSESSQMGWTAGIMEAIAKSADLNKTAARWTAATVVLGAASSVVGALSQLT